MAQEIMVMGAIYEGVPSVRLPDSNGVFHPFTDTSDTTAVAADVAQGKVFHLADGSAATGTAAGATLVTKSITANGTYDASDDGADGYSEVTVNVSGGGGAPKMGVLRPDAELWKSWTYDKWLVADEGITIPAYTTSVTTLKAKSTIETVALDIENYDYRMISRLLTSPAYNDASKSSGKQYYAICSGISDVFQIDRNVINDGTSFSGGMSPDTSNRGNNIITYWYSNGDLLYLTSNYGFYQQISYPLISGSNLIVSSPAFNARGNSSILSSAWWSRITDVRFQYVIELYRVQKGGPYFDGFDGKSQTMRAIECAQSASGDLT